MGKSVKKRLNLLKEIVCFFKCKLGRDATTKLRAITCLRRKSFNSKLHQYIALLQRVYKFIYGVYLSESVFYPIYFIFYQVRPFLPNIPFLIEDRENLNSRQILQFSYSQKKQKKTGFACNTEGEKIRKLSEKS